MDIFVNFDDRAQTAATNATHGFKGKTHIGHCFPIVYPQRLLNFFLDFISASHVAGSAEAYRDNISSSWLETEGTVKGPNTIDLAEGNPYLL